jgi:hypothetical protein
MMATDKANVVMHVNKFVHPCEKIPNVIKAAELKEFSEEYRLDENKDIADALINIDKTIIELLFGGSKGKHSRVRRFQTDYLPAEGYESEDEEEFAYTMFLDDVKTLRNTFKGYLS